MIEEHARVAVINDDGIYVETQRKSSCSSCSVSSGCGNSLLDNVFGQKRHRVRVLPFDGLSVGDDVVIGLAEEALIKGSLLVYIIPLILMIFSAMIFSFLLPAADDIWVAIAGLSGLFAGFLLLARYSAAIRYDRRYQPVVLRKL